MEAHLTDAEIAEYRSRRMPPAGILRVREHVDACAGCRGRLVDGAAAGAALVRAFLDPEPDEQDLVLFVTGRLPPERAAEIQAHAAQCVTCRGAIADLRQFPARPAAPIPMPVRRQPPVPLWWGAVAAGVAISFYFLAPRTPKPLILASLKDGSGAVTLRLPGGLDGLPNLTADERSWIDSALQSGTLRTGHELPPAEPGVLRGDGNPPGFALQAPLHQRLLADRPEFRWTQLAGASNYQVTVFTEDEKVVAQGTVAGNQWQPPAPLPRGTRLGWQVTAAIGSTRVTAPAPPEPRAIFEIVDADAFDRIERAWNTAPVSHLRLAVAYAREGLKEDALREIGALAAANPNSPLVRQLRDSLAVK